MSAEHTPGPWHIGAPPPNGERTISTEKGLMVSVATTGLGVPTLANARLIAAAPDLLQALEAFIAVAGDYPEMEEFASPEMRMARAAIAKAKGEA